MSNCILLVFEGEKTEKIIWDSLNRFYLTDIPNTIICSIYAGEIYSLYHKMKNDPDLDIFSLLKENLKNRISLASISKDMVSEVFLFFDYDGHASAADDEKLKLMLSHFDEETGNGRLYISYPMVEAIKHLNNQTLFANVVVPCKENIKYKGLVHTEADPSYRDLSNIDKTKWKKVISEHCIKLGYLMTDSISFPNEYHDQNKIFERQLEKHITPKREVAVLSAFPIFILDYYGCSRLAELLKSK